MEFTLKRNTQIVGFLLLFAAATQALYTTLYIGELEVPRQVLWGAEGIIFTLMAAFAGAAMLETGRFYLAWSAIAFASVLNVVQVGVGLTMFGPFFQAAEAVEGIMPAAQAIVAFSFMVYNAAKVLLAIALISLGVAKLGAGRKALCGLSVLIGVIAAISNALSLAMGRDFSGDLPIAGGSGVAATVLLAWCLFTLKADDA